MNCEAVQWALAQSAPTLSSSAKFLLVAIASRLEGGLLAASQAELAAIVSLGVRQVRTLLKDLEREGFIERKKQGGNGAGRLADAITVQFEQPAKTAASQQPENIAVASGKITRTKRKTLPQQPAEIAPGLAAIEDAEFVDNSDAPYKGTGARAQTLTNIITYQDSSEDTELVSTSGDSLFASLPTEKSKKRGTRMTPDWRPCEQKTRETARELGIINGWCQATLDNFIDYWLGVAGAKGCKQDWDATFRNALRAEARARRYVPTSYSQGTLNGQRTDRPDESTFIKAKRSRHIAALLGDEPDSSPIDYGRVDSSPIK